MSPPLRVFLIEDHDDTRELLCLWLQQLGHTVFTARSMREALEAIPHAHCDVLISDIGLPDGDGWELLHRLQTHRPRFAIAISGLGTAADCVRSKAAGFDHHLIKPSGTEELGRMLDHVAERRAGYVSEEVSA